MRRTTKFTVADRIDYRKKRDAERSERMERIGELLSCGYSRKEVAKMVGLSESTIRHYQH